MKLFLSHPRLAAMVTIVALSLSLTPAASAQLTDFLGVYTGLSAEEAVPHGVYDRRLDQGVLVSLRGLGVADPRLALDVTVQSDAGGTLTRTHYSPFLSLKNSSYEIAEVLADRDGYIIFLNKFFTQSSTWGSWAIKVTSDDLRVQWARELTYASDGISFFRVRDAVVTVNGYAVLADLNSSLIGRPTAVAMLDAGTGAISWTGQYFLSEDVELLKLEYGGFGLRALGWLTDPDSENFAEAAILSLSAGNGELLNAAHYPGAYAHFDIGTATTPPYGQLARGHYLGAQSGFGEALFIPILGSLEARPGVMIDQVGEVPSDFVILRDGGVVAQIEAPLGASVLSIPGPLHTGSGTPFYTLMNINPGPTTNFLRSMDPTLDGAMLSGSTTDSGVQRPFIATSQGVDFRSCLLSTDLPLRQVAEVETIYFKDWVSVAPLIESRDELFLFFYEYYPSPNLPCP